MNINNSKIFVETNSMTQGGIHPHIMFQMVAMLSMYKLQEHCQVLPVIDGKGDAWKINEAHL